jgi:hypothetical protein|uniref:Uncharacterized protein n=1 Tax=Arabidopsis thaliana TaxID=3702 RepID=Q56W40_ARATH|nr:hypothetical protein [Arabidopsis thaliana]
MVPLEMLPDEHKAVTVEVAYVGPEPSMKISPESEASSIAYTKNVFVMVRIKIVPYILIFQSYLLCYMCQCIGYEIKSCE